jgi:hypothetical protein
VYIYLKRKVGRYATGGRMGIRKKPNIVDFWFFTGFGKKMLVKGGNCCLS